MPQLKIFLALKKLWSYFCMGGGWSQTLRKNKIIYLLDDPPENVSDIYRIMKHGHRPTRGVATLPRTWQSKLEWLHFCEMRVLLIMIYLICRKLNSCAPPLPACWPSSASPPHPASLTLTSGLRSPVHTFFHRFHLLLVNYYCSHFAFSLHNITWLMLVVVVW